MCALNIRWNRSAGNGIARFGRFFFRGSMSSLLVDANRVRVAPGRPYVERVEEEPGWADAVAGALFKTAKQMSTAEWLSAGTKRQFSPLVAMHEARLRSVSSADLRGQAQAMR